MTVWEMLDLLESRIARLRAERAELACALEEAEQRLKTLSEDAAPKRVRRKPPKKTRKRAAAKTKPRATPAVAAVPAVPPAAPAPPSTGKRVALGMGLAQLRARTQVRPDPADMNR